VDQLDCSEDALVERPAIAFVRTLGWQTVNACGEFDGGRSHLPLTVTLGLLREKDRSQ